MNRYEVYYRDNTTGRRHSIEFMGTSEHDAIRKFYKFAGISSVSYQKVERIYGY